MPQHTPSGIGKSKRALDIYAVHVGRIEKVRIKAFRVATFNAASKASEMATVPYRAIVGMLRYIMGHTKLL